MCGGHVGYSGDRAENPASCTLTVLFGFWFCIVFTKWRAHPQHSAVLPTMSVVQTNPLDGGKVTNSGMVRLEVEQ